MSTGVRNALFRGILGAIDAVKGPRLSILIFHRVTPVIDPLFPLEVDARRFDALLSMVRASFNVLTIGQAHARINSGTLPPRALAISFDDGYADNAEIALPLLQKHDLKATFFVATGFLDGGRMWNDTVIEAVRSSGCGSIDMQWLGLDRLQVQTPAQRRTAIDLILPRIKYRSLAGREDAIARLLEACGQPTLPVNLMMRSEQVKALHAAGMEIGGHTVRHPILAEVSDADAWTEITDGAQRLRELTGAAVDVFAYPNGRPQRDYDHRHVAMVREAGFRCAVSTSVGVVDARAEAFEWPRFTPWDTSDLKWGARLLRCRYATTRR